MKKVTWGYVANKYYDLDGKLIKSQNSGASMEIESKGSNFETLQTLSGLQSTSFYNYIKALRDITNSKPKNAKKEKRISDL